MKTFSKLFMLGCARLSSIATAQSLEGSVTGTIGKPIVNGNVTFTTYA